MKLVGIEIAIELLANSETDHTDAVALAVELLRAVQWKNAIDPRHGFVGDLIGEYRLAGCPS